MIFSITEDQQGLIWLGTGNGIKSFDKKTPNFDIIIIMIQKIPPASVIILHKQFLPIQKIIYGSAMAVLELTGWIRKPVVITHYKHDPA